MLGKEPNRDIMSILTFSDIHDLFDGVDILQFILFSHELLGSECTRPGDHAVGFNGLLKGEFMVKSKTSVITFVPV
jgi:hypothetical protein